MFIYYWLNVKINEKDVSHVSVFFPLHKPFTFLYILNSLKHPAPFLLCSQGFSLRHSSDSIIQRFCSMIIWSEILQQSLQTSASSREITADILAMNQSASSGQDVGHRGNRGNMTDTDAPAHIHMWAGVRINRATQQVLSLCLSCTANYEAPQVNPTNTPADKVDPISLPPHSSSFIQPLLSLQCLSSTFLTLTHTNTHTWKCY